MSEAAVEEPGIVRFFSERGFGFIEPLDRSKDVFFHASAARWSGDVEQGTRVRFVREVDRRGRVRAAVVRLE